MAETLEHFGKLQEQSRRLKHIVETKMPEAVLRSGSFAIFAAAPRRKSMI
jgi:hypothetical protein